MKRFIQVSSFFLILSGFMLTPWLLDGEEVIAWVHLILGFFYIVAFALFSYDHVNQHRAILTSLHPRNITGLVQLFSGALVLLSGFVIYLYGGTRIEFWSDFHLVVTFAFMFSLLIHFRSKKE